MIKKGYNSKLHHYIFRRNKYGCISVSVFWMKGFGIYFKKNGGSFDITVDLFIFTVSICIWDKR